MDLKPIYCLWLRVSHGRSARQDEPEIFSPILFRAARKIDFFVFKRVGGKAHNSHTWDGRVCGLWLLFIPVK